jgi:hypothetical protein
VAREYVFQVLRSPCPFLFHRLRHIHQLSSGAGTIGQLVADVPKWTQSDATPRNQTHLGLSKGPNSVGVPYSLTDPVSDALNSLEHGRKFEFQSRVHLVRRQLLGPSYQAHLVAQSVE